MAEPNPTFFDLLGRFGYTVDDQVSAAVQLAVGAERRRTRPSRTLTRTTLLWAILHLDREIADAVRDGKVTEADLARSLGLDEVPPPADVDDVEIHDDLGRALQMYSEFREGPIAIDLAYLTYLILMDVEQHGGRLRRHLDEVGANVPNALVQTRRMVITRTQRSPDGDDGPPDLERSVGTKTSPSPPPDDIRPPSKAGMIEPPVISGAARLYLGFYEALAEGLLGTDDPEGIERRWLWPAFGLVAGRDKGTLATVVVRTVLRLRGIESDPAGDDGLRAFGLESDEPVPVDGPGLTRHPLVVRAGEVRDRVEPGEILHLRHFVPVALEIGEWPTWPGTDGGGSEAIRAAILDQIEHDAPPEVTERWRELLGIDPEAVGPVGRAIAGVGVDLVDERTVLSDELGVVGDVVTLCDMLAAKGAVAPISVGLFGRWGSGKSYFMALMRQRIDELCRTAREAESRHEETSYCPEIVQVTFNAWHYMDADDLWATLAVQLFNAIGRVDPAGEPARSRAEVVSELLERKQRMATVDRRITKVLRDPRLDAAAQRTGLAATREEALGLLGEVGTAVGFVAAAKAGWARRRGVAVTAGIASLGLAALTGLVAAGTIPVEWLLALVPFAGTFTVWLQRLRKGLAQLNHIAAESGLEPRDLTQERIARDSHVLALLDELDAIDRLAGVRDWVRERALSADYTSHFGVISVLRGDLEALVEKQRTDAPHRRIVLYIDDLDRCEPARVVEVLQAVHLLLAFPLFVAVVGVDPRWLLRSLERHYRQVLSTSDGGRPPVDDDLPVESTPHDYLEKIFQIPFALPPMESGGFGRLVASLVGPTVPAPTTGPPQGAVGSDTSTTLDQRVGVTGVDDVSNVDGLDVSDDLAQVDVDGLDEAQAPGPPPTSDDEPPPSLPLPPVVANPPQLQMTDDEVAALGRVGPLIGTPRAAKRLVNLYRLIRAGLDDAAVERFVADAEYRSLVIVLAVQVGWARASTAFLGELVATDDDAVTITGRLDALPALASHAGDEAVALVAALRAVCVGRDDRPDPAFDRPVGELRRWLPRLRRYSFEGALDPTAPRRPRTTASP